jgi:NAD(P)-dependent dehydrogenase (short-subunit alcohol dehydrogenase family)
MRFTNKSVLVTGGGSGIGRAVCLAFAREGADIGVADISVEGAESTMQEVKKAGRKAIALKADVTDPASVQAMVTQAGTALGSLDILVNSAGVREIVPFLELPFLEWQRVIAINLTGTFLCSQAVAQYLVKQGKGGKIVNLA